MLSPVIAPLHRRPEHEWSVTELAKVTAVSCSLLDARLRQVLGRYGSAPGAWRARHSQR